MHMHMKYANEAASTGLGHTLRSTFLSHSVPDVTLAIVSPRGEQVTLTSLIQGFSPLTAHQTHLGAPKKLPPARAHPRLIN